MITGHVDDNLEPIIHLLVRAGSRRGRTISFVVDTGYNGFLVLPSKLIGELQLLKLGSDEAELADGSIVEYRVFHAEVEWDGACIEIEVDESDTTPLLGTALLRGYELTAQMRPHGKLTLKKLPPKRTTKKRKP